MEKENGNSFDDILKMNGNHWQSTQQSSHTIEVVSEIGAGGNPILDIEIQGSHRRICQRYVGW